MVDEKHTQIYFNKRKLFVKFVSDFGDQDHGAGVFGREGRDRRRGDLLMEDRLCRREGKVGWRVAGWGGRGGGGGQGGAQPFPGVQDIPARLLAQTFPD